MACPSDRAQGVILITDYGALDKVLEIKARHEREAKEKENK